MSVLDHEESRLQIAAGSQLAHYRVTEKIGEGGMGVVWKAVDTSLNRDVAIKLLSDAGSPNPEPLGRFEREARLLAALNHPNIAAVYGLHRADGSDPAFIVMEYVEGQTLAERLAGGALPLDDTLEVVRQIADALESAHERGIIHRDLKPANVKIRPDGTVKVLDFGLARESIAEVSDARTSVAATVTATSAGTILGTAPYMSPEQARGKPVCSRTDLWALGCVLYECLTGALLFDGESTTDVLAKIVMQEPDLDRLPPATPPFLKRLLRRCLDKEPRRRLRDAGELRVAIEKYRADPESDPDGLVVPSRSAVRWPRWLPWLLTAVLGVLLIVAWSERADRDHGSTAPVSRWIVPLPAETRLDLPGPGGKFDYSNVVAISRDGSLIAFSAIDENEEARLFVKSESAEPVPIPGTANARAPFFSPDGKWLGFYTDGILKKTSLGGGSPQPVSDSVGRAIAFDAAWSPDGATIVFTADGLWRVSVANGATEQLSRPDVARDELAHHAPRFTSDGRSLLFTVSGPGGNRVARMDAAGGDWEIILEDAALGVQVGNDALVFARSGELFAAPFDGRQHRVAGPAIPVLQGIHTSPGLGGMVMTWFDVSDSGTLIYAPADTTRPDEKLLWVDIDGTETVIAEGKGTWVHPRLSPDATRISLDIHTPAGMRDVYLYELERGQFQQLTHGGVTWESEWSPDGESLAVLSGIQPGHWSLYQVRTDFSGPPDLLATTPHAVPGSWVSAGGALLYTEWDGGGIFRVDLQKVEVPEVVPATGRLQGFPRVSPDGRWMAYVAGNLTEREVYVQSYPDPGATHKVSIDGGREPVWAPDGKQLFYRKENQMLAVSVRYGTSLSFGKPRVLFEGVFDAAAVGHQHYDISGDATRFLMVRHGEPAGPRELRVVLNWKDELRETMSAQTPQR